MPSSSATADVRFDRTGSDAAGEPQLLMMRRTESVTPVRRSDRPVFVDGLSPCEDACPAGESVQSWLRLAEDGCYESAWRRIVEANPLPAVAGRVCYHPCETACNRGHLDSAVGVNSVERFLGDEAIRRGWRLPAPGASTGRQVLIVGAGPCGLSAAYQLRRLGHRVEIRDAGSQAGGMLRHGIPAFRLPRDVLDIEIARLLAMGIDLRLDTRVDDLAAAMCDGGFDAALLAMGAPVGRRAYIPAGQSAGMVDALSLLAHVADGERPQLGRTVIVYGGGDLAVDAARTARRLGADEALVVYRRTRDEMPANEDEVEEALAEGVHVKWLSSITQVDGTSLTVERMRLNEDGRPQSTGEFEQLTGDAVVLAVGRDIDRGVLATLPGVRVADGVVEVGPDLMTGLSGVFAGGDLTLAQRSVTGAIGHGARAARHINAWLTHGELAIEAAPPPVPYDRLNPWFYSDTPHVNRPRLDLAQRVDFSEVIGGLDGDTALVEARRCMSCGNCFGCDNCYELCPGNAILKVDGTCGYTVDYDSCTACGICATECPSGAILMRSVAT